MKKSHLDIEEVLADHYREDDLLEVPVGIRVFRVFFVIIFLVVGVVFVELVHLGVGQHDAYSARAVANMRDISVVAAPRGIIADRFGKALVHNDPAFSVFLVPRRLPQDVDAETAIFGKVSTLLGISEADLQNKLKEKDWSVSDRVLLSNSPSHNALIELSSDALPGIEVDPSFARTQDVPLAFSQLIGYTGLPGNDDLKTDPALSEEDQIGKDGLEASYDGYLRGVHGEDATFHNAKGVVEDSRTLRAPEAGSNLKTFIDAEFQEYFYNRLQEGLKQLGRNVGVGIAMDPRSGEVLALVNVPGFDSQNIENYLTSPYRPLFNRAVSGVYNPGSTIKPLVATAALTEGVIDPSKQIYSPGYLDVPNPYDAAHPSRFLDWRPQGWVNLQAALARSSNVYFYEVGGGFEDQIGLGITRLKTWWQKFGLDQKTGIDLPGEAVGVLPDPTWKEQRTGDPWRLGDTYNVTIGQGDFSITPIELLDYIGAIANGGKFWQPRIVDEVTNAAGSAVKKNSPVLLRDITGMIANAIGYVHAGMRDAVIKSYGTAYKLNDLPFPVAAKTGTAQIQNNQKTNAFFVGYAPYNDPQIAILVLVENSTEGSLNTVPVARDVLLWYYEHRLQH